MGDTPTPQNLSQSVGDQMKQFIQYLPQLIQTTNAQLTPTAQAQLDAAKAVSGGTNQLATEQAQNYLPTLAALGNQINNTSAMAGAKTTADVLGSNGQNIANTELAIDKSINPNYYSVQDNAAKKMNELLGSINLNGLSEGERAAVERSLNQQNQQSGNINTPSAINTVQNAMSFGNALQQKRTALGQALDTATSFLPNARAPISPIADTLSGASSATNNNNNPGVSQFQGIQSGAGGSVNGTANNFLNNIASTSATQQQLMMQGQSTVGKIGDILGSMPSVS